MGGSGGSGQLDGAVATAENKEYPVLEALALGFFRPSRASCRRGRASYPPLSAGAFSANAVRCRHGLGINPPVAGPRRP